MDLTSIGHSRHIQYLVYVCEWVCVCRKRARDVTPPRLSRWWDSVRLESICTVISCFYVSVIAVWGNKLLKQISLCGCLLSFLLCVWDCKWRKWRRWPPFPVDLSIEDYITHVCLLFPGGEQVFPPVIDVFDFDHLWTLNFLIGFCDLFTPALLIIYSSLFVVYECAVFIECCVTLLLYLFICKGGVKSPF